MTKQKRTRYQITGLVLMSIVIAAMTYGFTAAKPTYSNIGIFGADYGVLSPYEVSKVNYVLDLEDPTTFTAVEFIIDDGPSTVTAGVSINKDSQVTWAEHCEYSGVSWTCTFVESISVLDADWLHLE